jgi:putative transposase
MLRVTVRHWRSLALPRTDTGRNPAIHGRYIKHMPRIARVVLPGVPLHLTQRGIRRFDVFRDQADRQLYIRLLGGSCQRSGLRICAYCLMTNHVHVVAIPEREDSVAKALHRCHGVYARLFNLKYELSGHLWQARPYSAALDEQHLWAAIRYVELNPVRAGMINHAERYAWSSAAVHCGLKRDLLIHPEWASLDLIPDWKKWLEVGNKPEVDQLIRERTFTGLPCGSDLFTREAEHRLGRNLRPRKPGPKRK